jgi:hypothetical protein
VGVPCWRSDLRPAATIFGVQMYVSDHDAFPAAKQKRWLCVRKLATQIPPGWGPAVHGALSHDGPVYSDLRIRRILIHKMCVRWLTHMNRFCPLFLHGPMYVRWVHKKVESFVLWQALLRAVRAIGMRTISSRVRLRDPYDSQGTEVHVETKESKMNCIA